MRYLANVGASTKIAVLAVASAAIALLTVQPAVASTCDPATFGANPNDSNADDGAIQQCLNLGGTVLLSSGQPGYIVANTLHIVVGGTLQNPGTVITKNGTGPNPVVVADPGLGVTASEGGILVSASVNGFQIFNVTFDGNKANRNRADCDRRGNSFFTSLSFSADDFKLVGITSTNALCGSNAAVNGNRFEVGSSTFSNGGFPFQPQDVGGQVADGLTVLKCARDPELPATTAWIHDNFLSNNTDVNMALGGGQNCTVENNYIWNDSAHGHAGINVGWFPPAFPGSGGNYAGTIIRNNTIVSGTIDFGTGQKTTIANMLSFGIAAGFEPWWYEDSEPASHGVNAFVSNAGTISNNTIQGAVINLAIEGIGMGTVSGNSLSDPRGDFFFGAACNTSHPGMSAQNYTAHFWNRDHGNLGENASIPLNYAPYWFFGGKCGVWNTAIQPQPGQPGTLPHIRWLDSGQSLYSKNGAFHLEFQGSDGNVVLYRTSTNEVQWADCRGPVTNPWRLWMQPDGNFVLYTDVGQNALWWTITAPSFAYDGTYLAVTDDGQLVEYYLDGTVLWSGPPDTGQCPF